MLLPPDNLKHTSANKGISKYKSCLDQISIDLYCAYYSLIEGSVTNPILTNPLFAAADITMATFS